MKKNIFLFVLLIGENIPNLYSQNNLIPNPGFEVNQSGKSPQCIYADNVSGAKKFDSDIDWWRVAEHNTGKKSFTADWIGIAGSGSCSGSKIHTIVNNNSSAYCNPLTPSIYPSNRFVLVESNVVCKTNIFGNRKCKYDDYDHYTHEAIRSEFTNQQSLNASGTYILRMKVVPLPTPTDNTVFSSNSYLRIFFSKNSVNWSKPTWTGNQLFEAYNANLLISYSDNCAWQFIERSFTVPSNLPDIKNIVLFSEQNGYLIDDMELFQACPYQILIQNQDYNSTFYNSQANQGFPFAEKADNNIIAGYNVGDPDASPGNVIVRNGAQVTYTAGQRIVLEPGFTAETGSIFKAIIASCPNSFRVMNTDSILNNIKFEENAVEKSVEELTEADITPNPNNGNFSIYFNTEELSNKRIIISDVLGKIIYYGETADPMKTFDLSSHPKGIYFVKVQSGENIYTQKIIIQ